MNKFIMIAALAFVAACESTPDTVYVPKPVFPSPPELLMRPAPELVTIPYSPTEEEIEPESNENG